MAMSSRSNSSPGCGFGSVGMVRNDPSADREVLQPVVRVHPVTGRKALFVSEQMVDHFEGWSVADSAPLLDYLYAHLSQPAYTFRHRWQPGDIIMWDNRSALHLAANDDDGFRREMYRTTIAGGAPR